MPASLDHNHPGTPMGAHLVPGGATFRVWAPGAIAGQLTSPLTYPGRMTSKIIPTSAFTGKDWLKAIGP